MKRQGLTILEVLVAVAIFLMATVVIGQLLVTSGERALEIRYQSEAAMLCQTKLAELSAGAIPFESQSDVPMEEDDTWMWSLEAEQGPVSGVWKVRVSMARNRQDGSRAEYCSLSQIILDPTSRGSTLDTVSIGGSDTPMGGTSSSSGSSSSSNSSSSSSSSANSSSGSSGSSSGSSGNSAGGNSGGGSSSGGSSGGPSGSGSSGGPSGVSGSGSSGGPSGSSSSGSGRSAGSSSNQGPNR